MGCSSCGGAKAVAASTQTPYEVRLPDGKKVTVTSKAQERAEIDKAYVRMRAAARTKGGGYTVTR
jgi:hypothetical protein